MKLAILCYTINNGGAERVVATWANGLVAKGHEVMVYADFSEPVTYELDERIVRVSSPRWLVKGKVAKARRSLRTVVSLVRALRRFRPDAVLTAMHSFMPELLAARPFVPPFRLISTEHSSFERPSSAPFTRYEHFKKYRLNRVYDAVTVLTHPDRELLTEAGVKNVHVLHNPLFATPLATVPPKENTVLAVGRMDQWHVKGFDVLIKAWRRIAPEHPDWKLKIVGSSTPQATEYLTGLAAGCDSIEFEDYTTDIVDEYRRAAVFCLSSRYEGWGLVLVEAMSQHCACVACDYKGRQAEIVTDGKDGLLCPPDDEEALAFSLERLINDEALRQRLQADATANLARFAPEAVIERLEEVINC